MLTAAHRRVVFITALTMSVPMVAGSGAQLPRAASADHVVALGFVRPVGVAVDRGGAIFVSDAWAGTVTEVALGRRRVVLRDLERPAGLAFDDEGGLLVAEQGAGRVLRLDPAGAIAIVAAGLRRPRWVAAAAEGVVYVSDRDAIVGVPPSGTTRWVVRDLRGVRGIAWRDGVIYAAVRQQVVAFTVAADGTAGPAQVVIQSAARPVGVAVDVLGAVFTSVRGAVLKQVDADRVSEVATGLRNPRGLAFEPRGHLLVVEGAPHRWVRRVRAPSPPTASVASFVNQSPVSIAGQARPRSLVQVFHGADLTAALGSVAADAVSGGFTLSTPIPLNARSVLSFTATAAGGLGLTSAPVSHAIVHDGHQPAVAILEPAAGVHTLGSVAVRATGEDDLSGVAEMSVTWDDEPGGTVVNPDPREPLVLMATADTAGLNEGGRTLSITATDRAGNAASVAQLVVIDRTAPETRIASGPAAEINESTATFVFEGADLLSPTLDFAWRLDGAGWTPFGPEGTVTLSGLTPGEHRFEVKARDLAGNEDLTPATQTFVVRSLRIRLIEPVEGAVIATPTFWLRGSVDGGGDVTVSVPLAAGSVLPSLSAAAEGGMFALEIPTEAAAPRVLVTATDWTTGRSVTETLGIVYQPDDTAPAFGLKATPDGGAAPLVVGFGLSLPEGTHVTLDQDSDGSPDFDGDTLDGLTFVYNRPGVYVATVRATAGGETTTYRTSVEVYDVAKLNARIRAAWSGFTAALRSGDVARATAVIHGNRRARWQAFYGGLTAEELAAAADALTNIELVRVARGGAEYELLHEEGGRVFSYPVVFVADADGQWRLWQF